MTLNVPIEAMIFNILMNTYFNSLIDFFVFTQRLLHQDKLERVMRGDIRSAF